ncbi:hypothetical protein F01_420702 [Burkholderia cenocepacia]|nr:hypothetical protein F01_420702 [Burkholderia cenocepacia]
MRRRYGTRYFASRIDFRSDRLIGGRLFPQIDAAFRRVTIDLREFLRREFEVLQRTDVLAHLLGPACADQRGRHAAVTQHPRQRHLRKALPAPFGDRIELAHVLEVVRTQVLLLQRAAARLVHARVGRHAVQVLRREQALRERRERDAARADVVERAEQVVLDPAVQHVVRRLVNQQRHLVLREQRGHLARLRGRIRRNADVERLALLHGRRQRARRFLERRVRVETVRIEDVDVVEPHPLQALVEAREHVLARPAAAAVRPRPHVPAGLRRDQQLVAIRPEILLQQPAEVGFGAAVRRPVVVREVEVVDAEVERGAQDLALRRDRRRIAEVVPQAERQGGQFEPGLAAGAVLHAGITFGSCFVGHESVPSGHRGKGRAPATPMTRRRRRSHTTTMVAKAAGSRTAARRWTRPRSSPTLRRLESPFQRGWYVPGHLGCTARRRRCAAVFRRPVVPFDQRQRVALLHRLTRDEDDPADRRRRRGVVRRPDRPRDAGRQALIAPQRDARTTRITRAGRIKRNGRPGRPLLHSRSPAMHPHRLRIATAPAPRRRSRA